MSTEISRSEFSKIETAMQEAGFSVERVKQEISFALQLINKSKQLQACTKESLQIAVLNVSNIGLSLNPASKEACLVPRWNSTINKKEASLEPYYVGLVKLLTDAGSVTSILCQLIYENDQFEIDLANNINPVLHKPELNKSKRGNITGVYALATLPDKTRQVEYMDLGEVENIRQRSESYISYLAGKIQSCIWVSDFGEMMRKTVIKRIYKYLPRTDRMSFIDSAIQTDNIDYTASFDQLSFIDNLLRTSSLEERQRSAIEMETSVMSSQRASEVIKMLKENQLDPLSQGHLHNQTMTSEIMKKSLA